MLNDVQQEFARKTCVIALDHGCKVAIHFTKVDGSERTLTALPWSDVPDEKLPASSDVVKEIPSSTLRIFAEVEQDWRSIKVENIISMKVML